MSSYSYKYLQELTRSRQVIPTWKLLSILHHFEFKTRQTRGSHIVCSHPDIPGPGFNIISDTNKLDSQRLVLKASLRLLEYSLLENKKGIQQKAKAEFNRKTQPAEEESPETLIPEDMIVMHGRDRDLYLVSRETPQAAREIPKKYNQADIDKHAEYVRGRAERINNELEEATKNGEFIRHDYPNGAISLVHSRHKSITLFISPFTPRLKNWSVKDRILEVLIDADDRDRHIEAAFEKAIKDGAISVENTIDKSKKTFSYVDPVTGQQGKLTLPVSPNGKCSEQDFTEFALKLCEKKIENLRKNAKIMFAVNITKTNDGYWTGKHPYYDASFKVDDLDKLLEDARSVFFADEENGFLDEHEADIVNQNINKFHQSYEKIIAALRKVDEAVRQNSDWMNSIPPHIKVSFPYGMKAGEENLLSMSILGKTFQQTVILGKYRKGAHTVHVQPDKVPEIKKFFREAADLLKPPEKLKVDPLTNLLNPSNRIS